MKLDGRSPSAHSGIGLATAILFHGEGALVAVGNDPDRLGAAASAIRKNSSRSGPTCGDRPTSTG